MINLKSATILIPNILVISHYFVLYISSHNKRDSEHRMIYRMHIMLPVAVNKDRHIYIFRNRFTCVTGGPIFGAIPPPSHSMN